MKVLKPLSINPARCSNFEPSLPTVFTRGAKVSERENNGKVATRRSFKGCISSIKYSPHVTRDRKTETDASYIIQEKREEIKQK
jgi:hypothetical protein